MGGPAEAPAAPAAGGAPAAEAGLTPELIPSMREWFKKLVTTQQGVLFETPQLQVGVKHEYRGSQGRLTLFYGNKGAAPLEDMSVSLAKVSYLRVHAADGPTALAPKQQAQQLLQYEAMAPYSDAPPIEIAFTCGGTRHTYPMRLPIVATCFVDKLELDAPVYIQRWKALEGQGREQQETFQAGADIDVAAIKKMLTEGLHMGIANGADTSDATISVAGTYRTGAQSPSGDKVSVGLLTRLEINAAAKAFRLTVRAVHPQVAVAIKNIVKSQLA